MGILLAGLTTDGSVLSGFLLAEGLPEDWDDEEDGEWTAPTITNLEYKGPWNKKKIKNPSYPGKWKAHMIANPGFPLLLIKMPQELQDEEDPHKVKGLFDS